MFGRAIWDKLPNRSFENFEIIFVLLVLLGQFQNFQKYTRAIYPKSPSQTCD